MYCHWRIVVEGYLLTKIVQKCTKTLHFHIDRPNLKNFRELMAERGI